jgi:hypothetical protein
MQNINELAFRALAWRKPRSIPDAQRPNEVVAVFPRDPPVLVAVTSIEAGLMQLVPSLSGFLALKLQKQLVKNCIGEGLHFNPIRGRCIGKNTYTRTCS